MKRRYGFFKAFIFIAVMFVACFVTRNISFALEEITITEITPAALKEEIAFQLFVDEQGNITTLEYLPYNETDVRQNTGMILCIYNSTGEKKKLKMFTPKEQFTNKYILRTTYEGFVKGNDIYILEVQRQERRKDNQTVWEKAYLLRFDNKGKQKMRKEIVALVYSDKEGGYNRGFITPISMQADESDNIHFLYTALRLGSYALEYTAVTSSGKQITKPAVVPYDSLFHSKTMCLAKDGGFFISSYDNGSVELFKLNKDTTITKQKNVNIRGISSAIRLAYCKKDGNTYALYNGNIIRIEENGYIKLAELTKAEPLWQFVKPLKPGEVLIPDYFPDYYLIAIDEHTFYIVTAVSGLGSRGQICRVYKIGLG